MTVPGRVPFPARPALTAPFACAMALWAAVAASYDAARLADARTCMVMAAASLGCAAVFGLVLAFCPMLRRAYAVCALLVGLALGCAAGYAMHVGAAQWQGSDEQHVRLELLEDAAPTYGSCRMLARARLQDGRAIVVQAQLHSSSEFRYGDALEARGALSGIDPVADAYCWQRGASARFRANEESPVVDAGPFALLCLIRSRAIDGLGTGDDAGALLQALVCGYRLGIRDTLLYAAFQTCGIAHLVAVAGAHLVIVTGLFAALLKALRCPRRLSAVLLAGIMGAYLVVSAMPVSAVRAAFMAAAGLFSFTARRRPASLNALGIGAIAVLAHDPQAAVSASFALSVLSTAGIILFAPLIGVHVGRTPLAALPAVAEALALTAASALLSQLFSSSLFGQLPLISVVANAACAPLFPLACGAGLAAGVAAAAGAPFAGALVAVARIPALMLGQVAMALSQVPYACVPFWMPTAAALVISGAAALMLWLAWPQPRGRTWACGVIITCLIGATLVFLPHAGDELIMLDVGQGDSLLVRSRGQTLLVDTGNQDSRLLAQLATCRVAHLDSVLLTHADDDHYGSLDALDRAVDIDRALVAAGMLESDDPSCRALLEDARSAARSITGLSAGDEFCVGAFKLEVVWPRTFHDGGNADSLVLYVEYDGDDDGHADYTALLTGDAEKDELSAILGGGAVGPVDILKVGHHGSRNGFDAAEARALNPSVALIGVGERNRYGHPAQEALDLLVDVGCAVYRTDLDGQVRCTFTPGSLTVARGSPLPFLG